ncbi:MAG: ATP-dependent helicase UvrD/PcrA [Actinomycetota bacterium]|nr:ATP-dependent helicase UvrD/PcrA [Actinomycetota bacterium]
MFEDLNEPQLRAARHGDGPLLVVAGAGSGKTKTLASRVAYLLGEGVTPERILLLTFTRRASQEMLARAQRLTSGGGAALEGAAARVWGGTFHSVANRLLRTYGRALGVQPQFTIMDQTDAADLINLIRSESDVGQGERRFPKKDTLAAIYSRSVNSGTRLGDILSKHFPWCEEFHDAIKPIFETYTVRKRVQGVLDYDDLLLYWNALAATSPAGDKLGELFDHILVDEYQDTNSLQANILRNMRRSSNNVMAVGDDAQAIYSFRAATVANILEFPNHFPGTTIVKLEQNYRSTQPILAASNAVIAQAKKRYAKELRSEARSDQKPLLHTCVDESQQSDRVCETILEHREQDIPLTEQAVLFRASHHSAALEIELARRNIPFVKFGGLKFLEAAHVKDMLCFLRILENPWDEVSWFRILQLLNGVGAATAHSVMKALGVRREEPIGDDSELEHSPLAILAAVTPKVPRPAREELRDLSAAFIDCLGDDVAPAVQVERLRKFYEPIFHRVYDNAHVRLRDLEQLTQIASGYPTRSRFISDLTLDPPMSTGDYAAPPLLDEDYLILSTIHSAKGMEWDVVHVIHAADGMIPSDMSAGDEEEIEEELRLFYVALTRARHHLHVYFPLRYYHRRNGLDDAHNYAQLTRFIPGAIRPLFEETAAPAARQDTPIPVGMSGTPAAVEDFLAGLWT